jgi:glycosyltransferase involved in cell wall biosynthesis
LAFTRPLSIFLLVRSLELGGAERQLAQLACGLIQRGQQVQVGAFYKRGPLISELERAGVRVVDLAKRGRWDLVTFGLRLRRALLNFRPDVIYSFLGGANIAAATIRPVIPHLKLVWSIRASDMDLSRYDWTHQLGYRLEKLLSRSADAIIANSNAGRDFAVQNGFPSEMIDVVANGIDTERFQPDAALRARQRDAWRLTNGDFVVGILARLDPMKDHPTLLRAAASVAKIRPEVRFVCVGDGPRLSSLEALAAELDISERVLFPGAGDPVAALNAFDLACSSSTTEGFPNAVAEAMACGKPCVVTDVGDSAMIVGNAGSIVPPSDPDALARAILTEIEAQYSNGTASARQRIVEHFSVDAMVERTLHLFHQVVRGGGYSDSDQRLRN